MGRAGGSYEVQKSGKKKLLEQTKEAEPASGKTSRLEEQEISQKASANKTGTKG